MSGILFPALLLSVPASIAAYLLEWKLTVFLTAGLAILPQAAGWRVQLKNLSGSNFN